MKRDVFIFKKTNSLVVDRQKTDNINKKISFEELLTFSDNLKEYGYTLSENTVKDIFTKPKFNYTEIKAAVSKLEAVLSEVYDGRENYPVLFPEFDVNLDMEKTYIVQTLQYLFGYIPLEGFTVNDLKIPSDNKKMKTVVFRDETYYKDFFKFLLSQTVVLSDSDREGLIVMLDSFTKDEIIESLESIGSIKNRETNVIVLRYMLDKYNIEDTSYFFRTPKDLLSFMHREAYKINGKDFNPKKMIFPKYSDEELDMLGRIINSFSKNSINVLDDFKLNRYRTAWYKFFRYNEARLPNLPNLNYFKDIVYRKVKYDTPLGLVSEKYKTILNTDYSKDIDSFSADIIDLLDTYQSNRLAGYLTRDYIQTLVLIVDKTEYKSTQQLTLIQMLNDTLKTSFKKEKNDTKILVQLRNRLLDIKTEAPRVVMLKNQNFFTTVKHELEGVDKLTEDIINNSIQNIDKLLLDIYTVKENDRISKKTKYIYIDESLKNTPISTSERHKSSSPKSLFTGTRTPIDGDYIRLFTSWKDFDDVRFDIDLSLIMFEDENLEIYDTYAWYNYEYEKFIHYLDEEEQIYRNLKSYDYYNSVELFLRKKDEKLKKEIAEKSLQSFKKHTMFRFSGDIVDGKDGASEFIDINLEKASEKYRYILVNILSYRGFDLSLGAENGTPIRTGVIPFNEEVYSTYKIGDSPYVVKNLIDFQFDITTSGSKSKGVYPLIIDLKSKEMIWLDIPSTFSFGTVGLTFKNENFTTINSVLNNILYSEKTTVYDILELFAKAQDLEIVDKKQLDLLIEKDEVKVIEI